MRAQFIYEAFKEQSDPIKDFNIGEPLVRRFNVKRKTCYLEVTQPDGTTSIYGDFTDTYGNYMLRIKKFKEDGYKFRKATIITTTRVKNIEEL